MEDVTKVEDDSLFTIEEDDQSTNEAEESKVTEDQEAPAFVMPDKFKDKSVEDVVQSYQNLEKEHGRKSNEIHKLRELTDSILQQQVQGNGKPAAAEDDNDSVGFDDIVEDPQAAVNKAIARNPEFKKFQETNQLTAQQNAHKALVERHPDADQVVRSEDFQTWVTDSPGRQEMFKAAHTRLDTDLASDLLDTFKATKGALNANAIDERDAKAAADLKSATTESGGAGTKTSAKIWNRQKLMEMRLRNPTKYKEIQPEVSLAYAEGRVR